MTPKNQICTINFRDYTSSNGGATLVVSSNGSLPNTGVVWLVRRTSPPALEACNAGNPGAPFFQATVGGLFDIYRAPIVANGRVHFSPKGYVYVFGSTSYPSGLGTWPHSDEVRFPTAMAAYRAI